MISEQFLQRLWYQSKPRWLQLLLLPLSILFLVLTALRRGAYRTGLLRTHRLDRPVIVIGNITVGGTGKTPFVMWLAQYLRQRGCRVGVVLRGYGGGSMQWPRDVDADTPPSEVGDEAVLHARRSGTIVVAGPDRVAAARRAIDRGADVVLCDDGLQHYRLGRDCEIAVIDARRGLGSRLLLPAGPLRERSSRLDQVDLIVQTVRAADQEQPQNAKRVGARVRMIEAVSLLTGETRALDSFRSTRVHAIAGIGNPAAFFAALAEAGIAADSRALPDHAALTLADITFPDDASVLMTEKDAVKCRELADTRHWYVRMDLELSATDRDKVAGLMDRVLRADGGKR